MTRFRITTANLSLIGFLIVLLLTWFCYRPGFSGAFQLDDAANLGGLATVEDVASGSRFVLEGSNGPIGRPLSLLTFALQADQYQHGAGAFIKGNVAIHLLNGILLAWCLYGLAVLMAVERERAVLIATCTAGLWLLLPLLATASLLVVQRMTTLSSLFSLLGFGGYLSIRQHIEERPRHALLAMTVVLANATLLAALAKESGLLLPMLVLVAEATLLARPNSIARRNWETWKLIVLVIPSLAILAYLVSRSMYPEWMIARRDFDGWERLLTQSRILWLYLGKTLVGLPGHLGIYQTEIPLSRSLLEFGTLVASTAWVGLSAAAIIWRRRWPLFSFAVLWYLAGHVVESTVLPLELYFEHRNYLPIVGPLFALCMYLFAMPESRRRVIGSAIVVLMLLNASLLYLFSSISGEPSVAARYWAVKYPDSVRATTNLATYQLVEEGPERMMQTIRRFAAVHPEHVYLRIQELNVDCLLNIDADRHGVVAVLDAGLSDVVFTYAAGTMLSQLYSTASSRDCGPVDVATIKQLAIRLQQNARYVTDPFYSQFHHKLLASIARFEGDTDAMLSNLETAISHWQTPELNMMMVTALAGEGDYAGAEDFIDNAMLLKPLNPLKAIPWQRDLEELRTFVRELEKGESQGRAETTQSDTETD